MAGTLAHATVADRRLLRIKCLRRMSDQVRAIKFTLYQLACYPTGKLAVIVDMSNPRRPMMHLYSRDKGTQSQMVLSNKRLYTERRFMLTGEANAEGIVFKRVTGLREEVFLWPDRLLLSLPLNPVTIHSEAVETVYYMFQDFTHPTVKRIPRSPRSPA